jgi:hypothetical protein
MDFGALPPEINSVRIYAGPGSGPLLAAAAAWDGLAEDLYSSAASYGAVISALTSDVWSGPSSASMAAAGATYRAWMTSIAGQAEQAAMQARLAAAAYQTAFVMTVPPPVIAANRSRLAALVATNLCRDVGPRRGSYVRLCRILGERKPTDTVRPAGADHQRRRVGRASCRRRSGRRELRRSRRPDRHIWDIRGPAIDFRAAPGTAEPRVAGVVVASGPTGQLGPVRRRRGRGHRSCRCRCGSRGRLCWRGGHCAGSRGDGGAGLGGGFRWRPGCRIGVGRDGHSRFWGRGARGPP